MQWAQKYWHALPSLIIAGSVALGLNDSSPLSRLCTVACSEPSASPLQSILSLSGAEDEEPQIANPLGVRLLWILSFQATWFRG